MSEKKKCFVIMPFGQQGTKEREINLKIYQLMIKPVAEKCGYEVIRADEMENLGNITRDIIEMLHDSTLVIADLSGRNANVYYELGVRHTLFKCGTIPIIQEGELLPFDIANYRAIFYSIELDGREKFQKALEKRIKAFEKFGTKKSDNPVYDILGDSFFFKSEKDVESMIKDMEELRQEKHKLAENLEKLKKNYEAMNSEQQQLLTEKQKVEKNIGELERDKKQTENQAQMHKQKLQQQQNRIDAIEREKNELLSRLKQAEEQAEKNQDLLLRIKELEGKLSEKTDKAVKRHIDGKIFRSKPEELSQADVKKMLQRLDLYASDWNPKSSGFKNDYQVEEMNGEQVVVDQASSLMWQQSGSTKSMTFDKAKEWIDQLNESTFAGYSDWRLPTLEEGMSLMEPEKKNGNLYIDPIFDAKQPYIWTCDELTRGRGAWVVYFGYGRCYGYNFLYYSNYVRAVRS